MDAQVLNTAMEMVLEWGENFGKPIQERLRTIYPALSQAEADTYDSLCREIREYALAQIERVYVKKITGAEATASITAHCPLLHADTLSRLWSQGQYYAWKENG